MKNTSSVSDPTTEQGMLLLDFSHLRGLEVEISDSNALFMSIDVAMNI